MVPEKEFHSSELTGTTPNGNSGHHFDAYANGEIRFDGRANGEKLTHRSDVSIKSRSDTSDRDLIETLSDSAFCIVRRGEKVLAKSLSVSSYTYFHNVLKKLGT